MGFKKGHSPWNKGKSGCYSAAYKQNISTKARIRFKNKANHPAFGNKRPDLVLLNKERIGLPTWNKGLKTGFLGSAMTKIKHSINAKKRNFGKINCGKHPSEATKKKMGIARIGEKNVSWKGGVSFLSYPREFNIVLKNQIRQRDGFHCQECFRHQSELKRALSIHHIDFDKNNILPENLISLCNACHSQTIFKPAQWIAYYQERVKGGACERSSL